MFGQRLKNLREKSPLIHNITNSVTAHSVASMLLAIGASPIMADDIREVYDITSKADALNLNLGMPSDSKIKAMIIAGKRANEIGMPVIFDPVGVSMSKFREDAAHNLLQNIHFDVIKGNASEIKNLCLGKSYSKGVDACANDIITEDNLDEYITLAKKYSKDIGSIIVITGTIDIVADGNIAVCIRNGHADMKKVIGCGCMLSSMIAAFTAAENMDVPGNMEDFDSANKKDAVKIVSELFFLDEKDVVESASELDFANKKSLIADTAAAVAMMGICGEIAHDRIMAMENCYGIASYQNFLIDVASNMTAEILDRNIKYDIREA